ncbi:Uncharacterized protein APZ42_024985 [Daphnia magna]|uniref:Uncharacterized protein n=1 Tax=Daphnia magna TaxID=35525 RepID=A0A164TKA5_9CRUS|nr:Uncharacterized protein APZ42_024985 [Daphnia magna]
MAFSKQIGVHLFVQDTVPVSHSSVRFNKRPWYISASHGHLLSLTLLDDVSHILGRRHNLLSNLPTAFGKSSFSAEFPCSSWVEIEIVKMLIRGAHVKSDRTHHLKRRCGTRSQKTRSSSKFPIIQ